MMRDGDRQIDYVHKVRDDTRQYIQGLLQDNNRLQVLVTDLESQNTRLKRHFENQIAMLQEEMRLQKGDESKLQEQLAAIEEKNRRFLEQYNEVERQNSNLANLYVASYRLHGTLDNEQVLSVIQEIIINQIGSEEFGIFELNSEGGPLTLTAWLGIDPERYRTIRLGEGRIGRVALEGEMFVHDACEADNPDAGLESGADESLIACIPLKMDGRVTGAIAIFSLLPQKPALEELDRELFELLATHAATALYCTRLRNAAAAEQGVLTR
jgi:hypothetical protein